MILVTGANGFVGQELCRAILRQGGALRAASRSGTTYPGADNVTFDIGHLGNLEPYVEGAEVVIHLAARVHQLNDTALNPLCEFRKVNCDAALRLMAAAAAAGVRRFVYVSSIGVNGNETAPGLPFCETDPPAPHDLYAISKYEAELGLKELSRKCGIELVVVRPPLVYGPGAPGNFARLLKLVNTGLPLPLGSVANLRSFIYVRNLADSLLTCAAHPQAGSRTYLVSDGDDISTPALIAAIAALMDKPLRLVSIPPGIVRGLFQCVGKAGLFDKLASSLQVDCSAIRVELGWRPPYTLQQGLIATLKKEN